MVRLPVVVRRIVPGVAGVAPAGRVASRVLPGVAMVLGAVPVGVVITPGVLMAPAGVAPTGVFMVPGMVLLGTVPMVAPGWPDIVVPGVTGTVVVAGEPGTTVWAIAALLRPSTRREAKANPKVFMCNRINRRKEVRRTKLVRLAQ